AAVAGDGVVPADGRVRGPEPRRGGRAGGEGDGSDVGTAGDGVAGVSEIDVAIVAEEDVAAQAAADVVAAGAAEDGVVAAAAVDGVGAALPVGEAPGRTRPRIDAAVVPQDDVRAVAAVDHVTPVCGPGNGTPAEQRVVARAPGHRVVAALAVHPVV